MYTYFINYVAIFIFHLSQLLIPVKEDNVVVEIRTYKVNFWVFNRFIVDNFIVLKICIHLHYYSLACCIHNIKNSSFLSWNFDLLFISSVLDDSLDAPDLLCFIYFRVLSHFIYLNNMCLCINYYYCFILFINTIF